eukprot:scaffold116006_cov19-Tisochrysis_lutea.AAC.1
MVHCPTSPLAQVLRLVHKRLSMCAIIAAQKYDKHATQFASMLQLEPNMSMRKSSCKGGTGLHTCSPCLNSLTPQFPGSCTQCNHLVAPHKGWHPSSEVGIQFCHVHGTAHAHAHLCTLAESAAAAGPEDAGDHPAAEAILCEGGCPQQRTCHQPQSQPRLLPQH